MSETPETRRCLDRTARHTRAMAEDTVDQLTAALGAAHDAAAAYAAGLRERPVGPRASVDDLRAALGGPLPEEGIDAVEVVHALADAAEPGLVATGSPRYFGFVIGGVLPAGLGAGGGGRPGGPKAR